MRFRPEVEYDCVDISRAVAEFGFGFGRIPATLLIRFQPQLRLKHGRIFSFTPLSLLKFEIVKQSDMSKLPLSVIYVNIANLILTDNY